MYIYDGSLDKICLPTNRTIAVTSCGPCDCTTCDWYTIRENGRSDWSLYLCESGKIYFKDTYLSPGQVWIYPANVKQEYHIYQKDATTYRFLHFTGSDVAELIKTLGIDTLKPIEVTKKFGAETFDKISDELYRGTPLSQLKAEYYTIRLLSLLATDKQPHIKTLKCVTDDMEHSYATPYDAEKYARMLNLSVDRFNHIFKETMGISPMAYYNKLRINNACNLLENTTLKINEIATCLGYENPLYFSQAFKKATSLSPANYRKMHRLSSK